MRDFLKSSGRRVKAGWFWPLVLLALPNCVLQSGGLGGPAPALAFDPGLEPRSSAIMCDIPKVPDPNSNGCADSSEYYGMSLAHAAVALVQGEQNTLALDWSPAAEAACSGGPKKTEFFGAFPDGLAVCLNCETQIPVPYPDGNAVCVAKCIDLLNYSEGPTPPGGAEAYCQANAHVSTNFDKTTCYDDACTSPGVLRDDFVDPRRTQELVKWIDLIGTSAPSNTLTKTAATNGSYDAGAASAQTITHGDAWVEFEVTETDAGHALGVSPDTGTDTDPSTADIAFGINLNGDGNVYIVESGPQVGGSFGPYAVGERFRVHVVDNNDGTATISYSRLVGACTPGTICNETQIATQTAPSPAYPLRVDASLGNQNATLTNVTMVRIQ